MAEEARKSNPFMTMFLPGLVLGLVVGGLAGAFLPPVIENMTGGPASLSGGKPTSKPGTPNEHEGRGAVKAPDAPTPDAKPTETKPDEKKPETPPAAPATPPK